MIGGEAGERGSSQTVSGLEGQSDTGLNQGAFGGCEAKEL